MAARLIPIISRPTSMTIAEKDEFVAFVREAGKVTSQGLPDRVYRADFLVRMYDDGTLIGTAAIKVPDGGYPEGVFANAKAEGQADLYPRELGYVHVAEAHQSKGYSIALVEAAMSAAHGQALFATTASERMEKTLKRHGFTVLGEPYQSKDPNDVLKLFVQLA